VQRRLRVEYGRQHLRRVVHGLHRTAERSHDLRWHHLRVRLQRGLPRVQRLLCVEFADDQLRQQRVRTVPGARKLECDL